MSQVNQDSSMACVEKRYAPKRALVAFGASSSDMELARFVSKAECALWTCPRFGRKQSYGAEIGAPPVAQSLSQTLMGYLVRGYLW